MPTTTEGQTRRRISFPVRDFAAALFLWFGGIALLSVVADPPTVVVFGPQTYALAAAERAGTPLLSAGAGFVIVRGSRPGTVRALYAAGAWFVWPVIRGGCMG